MNIGGKIGIGVAVASLWVMLAAIGFNAFGVLTVDGLRYVLVFAALVGLAGGALMLTSIVVQIIREP